MNKFNSAKILVENKHSYATRRKEFGKKSTPFWIRLKPDAKLQTKIPTKVPSHYRDKLSTLLVYLPKKWNNKTKRLNASRKTKKISGSIDHQKKNVYLKIVLDAIHLNSSTNQSGLAGKLNCKHCFNELENLHQKMLL